jgi:hypothetical protein
MFMSCSYELLQEAGAKVEFQAYDFMGEAQGATGSKQHGGEQHGAQSNGWVVLTIANGWQAGA